MTRRWHAVLPSAGALLVRGSQLLVLLGLSNTAAQGERDALVASFGLLGALAIFTDSGAANFMLAISGDRLSRRDFRSILFLHVGLATVGGAATVVASVALYSDLLPPSAIVTIGALAVSQVLDSAVRAARAPLLASLQDARFAAADGALALSKLPIATLALVSGRLEWLWVLPIASLVILIPTLASARAHLVEGPRQVRLLDVTKVGASAAASAIYSQAPLVIATLMLPVVQAAQIAAVYRIIQPIEIIPSTAMQQVMPRMVRRRVAVLPAWAAFAAGGLAVALVGAPLLPIVEWMLGLQIEPESIYFVILASLPLKFGNYLIAGGFLVAGLAGTRLLIAVGVGAVTVSAAFLAADTGGAVAVASCTLLGEALLTGAGSWVLGALSRSKKRRGDA